MRVISGKARGRKLLTPQGLDVRPTTEITKEAVGSILQCEIEGAVVLDLFCGTGQMGIEMLSRGAQSCTFVDNAAASIEITKENVKKTGFFEQSNICRMDAAAFLKGSKQQFDIVFMDPPYEQGYSEKLMDELSQKVSEMGAILCETAHSEQPPQQAGAFHLYKTYRYGKSKVSLYRTKAWEEAQ